MRSYAHFRLIQASFGLQPACVEVRINRFGSPLELASDIAMGFCTIKHMLRDIDAECLFGNAHLCEKRD